MNGLLSSINHRVLQRFPPAVWLMTAIDFFVTVGFSVALPFLSLYLHTERGLPMTMVGALFLVGGLCTGVTNLIGGMLSDRLGRRRLFLTISIVSVFAYAALSLLIGVTAPVWLIAGVYILARSIIGTLQPTVMAIVADVSDRGRLTETYALVRVGGNIGFAFAPALGGFLLTVAPYGWLLSISAASCAIISVLVYLFLKETAYRTPEVVNLSSTLRVAKDRQFLVFSIFGVLLVLSMAHLGSTLSIFSVERLGFSTAEYGLLLAVNGVMVAVTQYPVAWIVNRFRKATGLMLGSLFYVAGYLSFGWIQNYSWALVGIIIITTGEVAFSPVSTAVVAESAPADKRGRYMGFFALSQTLGFALSPLYGGALLDAFPDNAIALWGAIAAVGLVAAGGFWWWGRMRQPRVIQTAA